MFRIVIPQFFRKAFGIYPGEGAHTLRFARLAILWAFASSCLDTLSDGLFLEKIGAHQLPRVYLLVALGMIGVSTLVLYSLRTLSPYKILTSAMGLGVVLCIGSALMASSSPPLWFWYFLKVASKMFFTVMIACSWTFTDQYHDLQDAKRVYSLYSAAYFFGTILSGLSINLFLDRLGLTGLLVASAASLLGATVVASRIAAKSKAIHDDTMEGVFSTSRDSFSSVVKLIVRSRFTIILLCLSLFVQLLVTVTEFNYLDTFGRAFRSSSSEVAEGQIAEFLGKCRAIISFCNILFGVFFYGRFVRRTGINNALLITPLFFLAVYSGWIFQDAMWIAVMGLLAVDGVLFTIEDNCFNLLSNAVPAKLKSKVRIINDSFFEPIGLALSSLLLFAMQAAGLWLGLVLTLAVLLLALIIRSIYSHAILLNLKDNAIHFEKKLKNWLSIMTKREQKEAKKDIYDSLLSTSEETRLLAIESLLDIGEPHAIPKILNAADSLGTLSKIHFLRLIDGSFASRDAQVLERIDAWSYESDSHELAKWANFYLAKQGLHHPEKAEDDIDDPDLMLRGAAILTLKKSIANQSLDYAGLNRTIASKKLELMLKSTNIDEVSLGLDILAEENSFDAAEKALAYLAHDSLLVKRSAARCIARLSSKALSRIAPRLIEELSIGDNAFRLSLLDALGKIADSTTTKEILLASIHFRPNERRRTEEIIIQMGLKIVPLLVTLTKDVALPERARILASKILGRLALPQLKANLIDLLDIEIERAYFYFYFGHTVQKQHPQHDLSMLQSALLTGYQSVIDFIIHLLGAAGSLEDPDLLVRSLHSRNAKVHSHAVESLEKTCDLSIFRLIAPLIDDLPLEEKMAACLRWQGHYPNLSLSELIGKLEQSPSLFDKIVAVQLKANLEMPGWKKHLREQMKRSDEHFQQFAYELLEI